MAVKDFFREIIFSICDRIATAAIVQVTPHTLLLVKVDAIGDYILFRNFIKVIKCSAKYKDYKIILCGNIIWKNLATQLDKKYIDEFIWVDKKKMVRNIIFRYQTLRKIRRLGVEVAINPTYSRDFYSGDSIIKSSKAIEKIGSQADMSILTERQRCRADKYYTRLISISENTLFEFDRNKKIISLITGESILLERPGIDIKNIDAGWFKQENDFVAICPSASMDAKKWNPDYFAEVANFIINQFKLDIVIVGAKEDTIISEKIIQSLDKQKVKDLTGKTSLSELSKILSFAKLVISNDTAAVHIAAAVNTPVICISKGDHFGRFNEYPSNKTLFFKTLYPDELNRNLNDKNFLEKEIRYLSKLDINTISVKTVQQTVEEVLLPVTNK